MAYRDEAGDVEGDFDDQLEYARQGGYRAGADAVLDYIRSIHAYPKLTAELKWAMNQGII